MPFADIEHKRTLITEDYVFTFGQYKGETILEVLEHDASYIDWCSREIDWFDLSTSVEDKVMERISDDEGFYSYNYQRDDEDIYGYEDYF